MIKTTLFPGGRRMTNGCAHARASLTLAPIVALTTTGLVSLPAGLLAGVGCLSGIIISPDLDLVGITYSERIVVQKVGRLGWLWWLYWYPYGKLVGHRSKVSHAPILSTVLRLIYLLGIPVLLGLRLPPLFLWFAVGLAASDCLHFLMDR